MIAGNLCDNDVADWNNEDEVWSYQPARCNQLIVKLTKPFNAETPPQVQVDHFETPKYVLLLNPNLQLRKALLWKQTFEKQCLKPPPDCVMVLRKQRA